MSIFSLILIRKAGSIFSIKVPKEHLKPLANQMVEKLRIEFLV